MGVRRKKSVYLVWSRSRESIEDWSLWGIGSDQPSAKIMADMARAVGRTANIQPLLCDVFHPRGDLDVSQPYTVEEGSNED